MNLYVMNFNRIRDLVSNLGWTDENQAYHMTSECIDTLVKLEEELMNEDPINRNVRLSLHMCGSIKKDFIPILVNGKDPHITAAVIRVLANLSLPVEYLMPPEATLAPKYQNVQKQIVSSVYNIKKSFLDSSATWSLITTLKEIMMKSEKRQISLKEEDYDHVMDCLLLLRNILYVPEEKGLLDPKGTHMFCDWQSVQNKLIWNLFVQGIGCALILILNCKYKERWTVPLTLIIAFLYRNQNIGKVHQAMESISSASESSEDEESDSSKNSSISLSSGLSKAMEVSDSGCPLTSESSFNAQQVDSTPEKCEMTSENIPSEIQTQLEKVQISDDSDNDLQAVRGHRFKMLQGKGINFNENDSESSSWSDAPCHKKVKRNTSDDASCASKADSAISIGQNSGDFTDNKSSEDDSFDDQRPGENLKAVQKLRSLQMQRPDEDLKAVQKLRSLQMQRPDENLKAVQKLRSLQMHLKMSESDSSNEDIQGVKVKYRSHPPTGRRGKSPRRKNGCCPTICMSSAYETSCSKGRMRYPLWEQKNSISTLVDLDSPTPSDDDIRNLLKEFTLSFLHSGFSQLVQDLVNLFHKSPCLALDKSLCYWMLSYFLNLATTGNICLDHISDILNVELINFLIFECVCACESLALHASLSEMHLNYITVHFNLLVIALKEVIWTVDLYSRKCNSLKDRVMFNNLCGKLAGLQDLRNVPLLLFHHRPRENFEKFTENVILLNHLVLNIIGRGQDYCTEPNKINFVSHIKAFSTPDIVHCYGKCLENFKSNSCYLNDCVFNMLHHLAGDICASELLFDPLILKVFSNVLNEEIELEQYQEDLIMYILNKFSLQVYKKKMMDEKSDGSANMDSSDGSSSCGSSDFLHSENDDLFWWYLQFELDKDPITRISEYISVSKQEILAKLQLKGHITPEKHKLLEEKMESAPENTLSKALSPASNVENEVTQLLRNLVQAGERQYLIWLQNILLETCYVKLGLNEKLPEVIPLYANKMKLPVPLVPYTDGQRAILKNSTFLQLLQKMGLHLNPNVMYPRIPTIWTADELYKMAARLGPVDRDTLKFSYEDLALFNSDEDLIPENSFSLRPPISSCSILSTTWIAAVQKNKGTQHEVASS